MVGWGYLFEKRQKWHVCPMLLEVCHGGCEKMPVVKRSIVAIHSVRTSSSQIGNFKV